jgi:hypothetical protein
MVRLLGRQRIGLGEERAFLGQHRGHCQRAEAAAGVAEKLAAIELPMN